jgi:type VI protein secretion system component Hcp
MALDAYLELLKADGKTPVIKGECLDYHFGDDQFPMVLQSFSLESQADLSQEDALKSKGGEDEGNLFSFTIVKEVDKATPYLFYAYCHYASKNPQKPNPLEIALARVTIRKAAGIMKGQGGGVQARVLGFLVYEFRDVAIKSWKLDNKDGDDLPEEEVEFTFNAVRVTYTPQKSTGEGATAIPRSWNFTANKDTF